MFTNAQPYFPNFAISPPNMFYHLYPCAEEDKEMDTFQNDRIFYPFNTAIEMTPTPSEMYIPFSNFEMDRIAEHLQKPIGDLYDESLLIQEYCVASAEVFNTRNFANQYGDHGKKETKIIEVKCMFDIIHGIVIPKWRRYLQLKSDRSIESHIKPRQDTLWKKIFRDVREFFRILFRLRFHYLEFRDTRGAEMCIKTFFEEVGIPLSDEEAYDHKLFRFVHQTHKLDPNAHGNRAVSPFEAIAKFNEIYKKSFMTNFTCARMFYFVYQNFLEEYILHIKHRYRKDVVTMICMTLNCYRKMSSCLHIKRI